MNFLKIYGVGIFILVFLTVYSEASAQYLTGMFFYLAKSVIDGGLPGIIRTMRAGKSVPFVPEVRGEQPEDISPMAMARAREADNDILTDSESKVRRLVRQLWPDLDCETDNTCKVPADSVLKSDSRENSASTSSSEENFLPEPSAEEEQGPMGNNFIEPETHDTEGEEMPEEELIQENPFYLTSAERETRRKIRRQNRIREREPPPPPPPPPPFHFQNQMYHDEQERDEDGMHPDGPPPRGPPPHHHFGPPPPPWMHRPFGHFPPTPQPIRRKRPNPIPVSVTPQRTPLTQDFLKYSKVFKPNPSTTTPKPPPAVISKRFLRILKQHPSIQFT